MVFVCMSVRAGVSGYKSQKTICKSWSHFNGFDKVNLGLPVAP